MTQNQIKLIVASLFIIAVMIVLVPVSTALLGLKTGMFLSMMIYWFALCLPFSIHFQGWAGIKSSLRLGSGTPLWVPIVALALPILMIIYLLFDIGQIFSLGLVLAVLPLALINGTMEEVFWRGTFQKFAEESRVFWGIGLILFTAWHIALIFAVGVVHHGGALTLLAGAFGLGLIWTAMTIFTGRIGWNVVSHILINVIAFSLAFTQN